MKKPRGIVTPWSGREEEKKEVPLDEHLMTVARAGTMLLRFSGRVYTLKVKLKVKLPDAESQLAAKIVLGECVERLRAVSGFAAVLKVQSLGFRENDVPSGAMQLTLGNTTLYAAASTTDEDTAVKMAIDRLALALTHARHTLQGVAAVLDAHGVEISRAA